MKSTLVYQLGYDSDSDQEYLINTGLFVVTIDREDMLEDVIISRANEQWGPDWFGLSYQPWNHNNRNVTSKRVFKKAVK